MTEAPETPKKPEPVPENKTAEKIVLEGRRMRGYLTAFKRRAQALEGLEKVARALTSQPPLGMVGVDAYERRLQDWTNRLGHALAEAAAARIELEAKGKP